MCDETDVSGLGVDVTAEATVVCAVDSGAVTEEVAGVVTASVAGVVDGVSFDASVTEVASTFCVS